MSIENALLRCYVSSFVSLLLYPIVSVVRFFSSALNPETRTYFISSIFTTFICIIALPIIIINFILGRYRS